MAETSFSEHEFTTLIGFPTSSGLYHAYRCRKPGTGIYGFDVTFIPGSVIVTGDIGELILQRDNDMMPWIRGVLGEGRDHASIDFRYVAEKVPNNIITRAWSKEAATEVVDRVLTADGDEESAPEIDYEDRLALYEFSDEHEWSRKCDDLYQIEPCFYEYGDAKDWSPRFLWCVFALRWFINAFDVKDQS